MELYTWHAAKKPYHGWELKLNETETVRLNETANQQLRDVQRYVTWLTAKDPMGVEDTIWVSDAFNANGIANAQTRALSKMLHMAAVKMETAHKLYSDINRAYEQNA